MKFERLAGIGSLALLAAAQARGQEREITVNLENAQIVPFVLLAQTQATATRIYAGFGVRPICCHAQNLPPPLKLKSGLLVTCANGFTARECRDRQAAIRRALETLQPALQDWRFIIVPEHAWKQTCAAFQRGGSVPAFSNLVLRATYLNSRLAILIEPSQFDEELARFTHLTGLARLEWVLGHELGHILCGTADEQEAEDAGNRLRRSTSHQVECRNGQSGLRMNRP